MGRGISLAMDAYGWIIRLDENGKGVEPFWIGLAERRHAPAGMVATDHHLYVFAHGLMAASLVPLDELNADPVAISPYPPHEAGWFKIDPLPRATRAETNGSTKWRTRTVMGILWQFWLRQPQFLPRT